MKENDLGKFIRFDYGKLVKTFAKSIDTGAEYSISYPEKSLNVLSVAVNTEGTRIECSFRLGAYDAVVDVDRVFLAGKKLNDWMSRLEYELEQAFLKNIKVETEELRDAYRIRIQM